MGSGGVATRRGTVSPRGRVGRGGFDPVLVEGVSGDGGGATMDPRTRWFGALSLATAGALLVSGVAYLALLEPLAWTVYVSGPLLLAWVTVIGVGSLRAPLAKRVAGDRPTDVSSAPHRV